jgi:hypothetical protein
LCNDIVHKFLHASALVPEIILICILVLV